MQAGRKRIFAITGSASVHSSNERLVKRLAGMLGADFDVVVYSDLKLLPHFDPELSASQPPDEVVRLRNEIQRAHGVLICTPEYIFSIPAGLKNALEWCVATTVFSGKKTALITASANGENGHDELQLIMRTLMADMTPETCLLISGIKGKMDAEGRITHTPTEAVLRLFADAFRQMLH